MVSNMVTRLQRCLVGLLLVSVAVALAGCNNSNDGYRSLTVENELCHFSLDYSTYYELEGPMYDIEHTIPATWVHFGAPKKYVDMVVPADDDSIRTVSVSYVPASIRIDVYDPSPSSTAPQNALGRIEGTLSDHAKWDNFELLERSPVTVSGIEGELIYYVTDWVGLFPSTEGPKLEYIKQVFFDYDGLIWNIKAMSRMEIDHRVMDDFEHLIETFQILD
jgi:hypothetical protein